MTSGRIEDERTSPPLGDAPRPAAGAWATALVVDDEIPALDELTYLLRAMPSVSSVHAARNPSEALRSLQERRYDVVFLDVRMPSLNGIELANVLGRFASPPAVVFVTAYEEYAVRAFDIGACDYLLKPVSRSRLSTALDRALGRSGDRAGEPSDGERAASRGRSAHCDRLAVSMPPPAAKEPVPDIARVAPAHRKPLAEDFDAVVVSGHGQLGDVTDGDQVAAMYADEAVRCPPLLQMGDRHPQQV